ncbi:PLC-like phosphodiesterase [Roridomyces roridus]|uniref:PLC-like phosphodiesterase n=1 Tax=Roridomyces roridus TaxID=1738132 RepID=A0AAD7FC57_9AGAR|nr:PLC-like phosphodiesterase [Roridomyces roridus]
MAFYGWPFSQCQSISTPLSVQFHSGIRLLDIRLTEVNGRLMSFHGVYPQKTSFIFILECLHAFLTSPEGSRETIVVSIKPEATGYNFDGLVHKEISESVGGWNMWFLESRIPALGEVRGKAVMFSRFGRGDEWKTGMGIHPTYWPDSEMDGFTWMCNETTVRTNDWYHIPSFISIPEKVALSTSVLLPPPPTAASGPLLNITYFSASSFPLASPQTVSQGFGWPKWGLGVEGVNTRVARWVTERLSEDEPKIRGWSFIDYYEEPKNVLVPLLIELNYRGRVPGEDGW